LRLPGQRNARIAGRNPWDHTSAIGLHQILAIDYILQRDRSSNSCWDLLLGLQARVELVVDGLGIGETVSDSFIADGVELGRRLCSAGSSYSGGADAPPAGGWLGEFTSLLQSSDLKTLASSLAA